MLIGIGTGGAVIFTGGTALEGVPWAMRLLWQQKESDISLSFTEHGDEQAAKRGFTNENITKIIKDGKAVRATGRYGPQTRYTLGENTVIVKDKGQIITTYSSNAPSGVFIPFK
jgi:hypothetical protein